MDTQLFQYVISAGDVAIVTIVIAITFSLWGGFLLYLYSKRSDQQWK